MRTGSIATSALFFLGFLVLLVPGASRAQDTQALRGPAFSSPAAPLPMPENWQQQPFHYEPWGENADLALSLDQQLYAALRPMIDRFAAEEHLIIKVQEGTCGISAGQLLQKSADITGFCCPPGETDRLPGLEFHTLGIAALHIIVNHANPVSNLSLAQVREIFQGKTSSWNALPGLADRFSKTAAIHPIIRLHCKNRPGHWRLLLDHEDLFGARVQDVGTIQDMINKVAADQDAIGYEMRWHINHLDQKGRTKSIRIDNADPNRPQDLLTKAYPFYRTFNITTWTAASPRKDLALRLIKYIESHFDEIDSHHALIPASALRQAGWKFTDNELTAEPE